MKPIVDALIYLHSQNPPIVHRDIKPSNIIVSTRGGEAVLVDLASLKSTSKITLQQLFVMVHLAMQRQSSMEAVPIPVQILWPWSNALHIVNWYHTY